MQGLRAAHFDEPALWLLFVLLDPEGNYSLYRRVWKKTRGVPFLYPHIRKYAIDGEGSLSEIFSRELVENGSRPMWSLLDYGYSAPPAEIFTDRLEVEQAEDRQASNYWEIWVKPFIRLFCGFGV